MGDLYKSWVFFTFSAISILSCVLILTVYYKNRDLQFPAFTLVKDLTVINLIYGFALLIPNLSEATCQIQGISIQFMTSLLIFWTAVIAHSLNLNIIKHVLIDDRFYRRRAIIAVLAGALFLTLVPFTGTKFHQTAYGPAEPWCWLANLEPLLAWQLGVFYIPCLLVFMYDVVVTIWVLIIIRREAKNEHSLVMFEWPVRIRLWLYPCAILIPFGPCALLRATNDYWAEHACAIAAPLSGIVTTLIYGLTEQVRSHLCPCLWSRRQPITERTSTFMILDQLHEPTVSETT